MHLGIFDQPGENEFLNRLFILDFGIVGERSRGTGKALKDELAGLGSFRVSSFRIICRIKDPEQIELVAIGPRGRIYEETFRMIQNEAGK